MRTTNTVCVSLVDANRIPVSFRRPAYNVFEAEKQVAITLDAHADHDFSFYVYVTTREGTATCEDHAVVNTVRSIIIVTALRCSSEYII